MAGPLVFLLGLALGFAACQFYMTRSRREARRLRRLAEANPVVETDTTSDPVTGE